MISASVEVSIKGRNVTAELGDWFESITYTDNSGGKADDLSISLDNSDGRFFDKWAILKGDTLNAVIYSGGAVLDCGGFTVDEITFSGWPSVCEVKGVSVPTKTPIRRVARSRAWEKVTLNDIAGDIAKLGKLGLKYATKTNPSFDRIEQRAESDLAFLSRLATGAGLDLKATGASLIIHDRDDAAKRPAACEFTPSAELLSYSITDQDHSTYSGAQVAYHDPRTKKLVKVLVGDESGKVKHCRTKATSHADAEEKARAALAKANRTGTTASLTVPGNPKLVAGGSITIKGFGPVDGRYIIDSAKHSLGAGYTVAMEAHKHV